MIVSSVIQMKNTLVKYLDYEVNETNPDLNFRQTQQHVIEPDMEYSVCTPDSISCASVPSLPTLQEEKTSLNMLVFHDDSTYQLSFLKKSLTKKGVKIVDFPGCYDVKSIVPFLLLNDHSILLVKNPKKDILPILKTIMRYGVIFYSANGQPPKPIKLNITVWVYFDIVPHL